MRKSIIISIFILSSALFSQQVWVQSFNGASSLYDMARDVAVDGSGNIYVCGYSAVLNSNQESVLVKYNSQGVKLWERYLSTPNNSNAEVANALAIDASGNIYMVGRFYSSSFPSGFIAKYSQDGTNIYAREFDRGGGYDDEFYALAVDGEGNLYVTGFCEGVDSQYDIAVIKFNSASTTVWARYYTNPLHREDRGYDIKLDQSGNVYVSGFVTDSVSADRQEPILLKYDNSGNLQWRQTYRSSVAGPGEYSSIAIDPMGNVYAGGYSTETSTNNRDLLLAKYSPSGNRDWLKSVNGGSSDRIWDVVSDAASNVYAAGSLGPDMLTVKYNTAGVQQWQSLYNGPANLGDEAYELAVDNDGNVYTAGMTNPANFLSDAAIVKYNSAGVQQWSDVYSGARNRFDSFFGIALDPAGFVVAAGYTEITAANYTDMLIIKYNQTVGINPISNIIPEKHALLQNYPNPFNPTTNFEFRIAEFGFVNIKIFDLTGREVETLVKNNLSAGVYKIDWNASNYSSGVYFYKISAGDFYDVKKMVLVK